jgi:succinoglycan biosynthesis transport protein ExoP
MTTLPNTDTTPHETNELLAIALRFLRSVRSRKEVMIAVVAVAAVIGGTYFLLTARKFESSAELLVLETGKKTLNASNENQQQLNDAMPNYERLLMSDAVLKTTLKGLAPEHRSDFADVVPSKWLDAFRKLISVSVTKRTNILRVTYRSENPETAYFVVAGLLQSYLDEMNAIHRDSAHDLLDILTREKLRLEGDIHVAETELLRMRSESQLLFDSGSKSTNVVTDQVLKFNEALVEAQKVLLDSRAYYLAVVTAIERGEDIQQLAAKVNEGFATELLKKNMGVDPADGYTFSRIQQQLMADESELQKKLETLGERHPRIQELRSRIFQANKWVTERPRQVADAIKLISDQELRPRLLEMANQRYQMASQHERELRAEYERLRQIALGLNQQLAEVEFKDLEVARMRRYYDVLLDTIKNVNLGKDQGVRTRVILEPKIDKQPVSPRLSLTGLATLALGLFFGSAAVYVMDLIDDRFRSPDDLRREIGVPVLAMIRKLPPLEGEGLQTIYPFAKPNSVESEAFRALRTAIDFSGEDLHRLTISSTEPSDGKTTVIASLAVAFAQAGRRTLVIDGDMRRPGMTTLLQLRRQPGLSTLLRDRRPVDEMVSEVVVKTDMELLDIIPSGPRPQNPAELLGTDRMQDLVSWAEGKYDQILIDAPPSLAVTDVQIIGRLVDGAIMTVRPDKNRRRMVIRAAESLTALGCRLVGLVVNQLASKGNDEYSYGYGYGYGYGEGYGHDEAPEHDEMGEAVGDRKAA